MNRILLGAAISLVIIATWFVLWHSMMAPDVARVKASIANHYKQLRTTSQTTSLEADDVYATGFPFSFKVAVQRATLSMVEGDETFAVSIPLLTLEATERAQGIYRVDLPSTIEALYAKNGSAPENYRVTADALPKLKLSAIDSKNNCGPLLGRPCADVPADAPLISYAVGFPESITLHMQLATDSADAKFTLPAIAVPIYQPIPNDLSRPLTLFVRVLREALVFKTR